MFGFYHTHTHTHIKGSKMTKANKPAIGDGKSWLIITWGGYAGSDGPIRVRLVHTNPQFGKRRIELLDGGYLQVLESNWGEGLESLENWRDISGKLLEAS